MRTTSTKRKVTMMVSLLAVSALGLAGCSSNSTTPAADGSAAPETPSEPITLSYIHRLPDGEGMTAVADIVKTWNEENPNIQVQTTKFDGKAQELIKKLETDIKANNGPCLAQLGYAEVPEMFTKGLLEDVSKDAEMYKDNFSAGAMSAMNVGGKYVGLPQDTGPLVYYYNKAEFEKLGLTVPKTLDEFKAEAAKAKAAGKYLIDFQPDEAQYWLSALSASAGDTWFSAESDKWKVSTDGAGSKVVSDFLQSLLDAGQAATYPRWDDTFTQALKSGEIIGHIGAAWEAAFLLDSVVPEGEQGTWAVAQIPDFGKGAMSGPDGGSGVAVMKGCAHPAEAMKFNNWFNTQIDGLVSQGLVVAAKGKMTTPEKIMRQFGGQDVFAELATANANMNPNFPYMPGFSTLHDAMVDAASKAAKGEGKVMDVFTAAQSSAIASLKNLGLPVAE